MKSDTIWLTQAQMVELFQSSKANINEHISRIFEEGELDENSTVRHFRTVATNGKTYNMKYYNLDMIISVGYMVKSKIATQFRKWATQVLREYLVQGYAINERRLAEQQQQIETLKTLINLVERGVQNQVENLFRSNSIKSVIFNCVIELFYKHSFKIFNTILFIKQNHRFFIFDFINASVR